MRLYIILQIISLSSSVLKSPLRVLILFLYVISSLPGSGSMAFSKPDIDRVDSLNTDHVRCGFNYDTNWDCCDYVDPSSLSDIVGAQDLVILQWNTRGLRGKLDDIEDFLNNILEQKVGIVLICETWLNNKSPPLLSIKVYKFIGKPRIDRKGGGVGFLIRNDIMFRRKESLEVNSKVLENMIIEVKCKTNILLCSSYRPPNTDPALFNTDYLKMMKIWETINIQIAS